MTNPIVIAALIAGIFGIIGSLISFFLIKKLETKLQVRSQVDLRLYERAMENLAEQSKQFKEVHKALLDYRNGVFWDSSSAQSERINNFSFYMACIGLQLPGVYVPPDIAKEIDGFRQRYQALKSRLYLAGRSSDREVRKREIDPCDREADEILQQIGDLIERWKNKLLHANNVLDVMLDQ